MPPGSRSRNPPQEPPLFNTTPDSLVREARTLIEQSRNVQNELIKNFKPETATFATVLLPLAQNDNASKARSHVITLHHAVSPDQALRDASNEARTLLNDFAAETALREDLFVLIDAVWKKRTEEDLDTESLLLLEKEHRRFICDGSGLPAGQKRERFREIKRTLSGINVSFQKNLIEESDGIWLLPQELEGVPPDVLARLEKGAPGNDGENGGKMCLTFQWSEYFAAMEYATNGHTRKRVFLGNENKCAENVPLFSETIMLRDEAARLLGYANHAEYRLENKMINSPQEINSFLADLRSRLAGRGAQELAELRQLKKRDLGQNNYDGHFYIWDYRFYSRMMLQQRYSVDRQQIAEYFPLAATMPAILRIFEKIFGLVFIEYGTPNANGITPSLFDSGHTWHGSVRMCTVWNRSNGRSGGFVGYLFLDLHSRPGKFSQAATFNVQPGFTYPNHTRHHPSTALICNLPAPTASNPSLLTHEDILQLFHELGHCIHDLVSMTRFATFHGTQTVQDFCEAPALMLEMWCWDPRLLSEISGHHITGVKIPEEMVTGLVGCKGVNSALACLRQLHLCMFDMQIHQPQPSHMASSSKISELYGDLWSEITGLECVPPPPPPQQNRGWGHGQATFFHLMGDYDAGYYGYLISKVFAMDMFDVGFKGRIGDDRVEREGRRYRQLVLEKGGARPAGEIVRGFLGREVDFEPFLKELGLN
ncbi:MAG: hypothetical protein Q9184_006380 [Pyrenodesmia sp. 2 TL-2023]